MATPIAMNGAAAATVAAIAASIELIDLRAEVVHDLADLVEHSSGDWFDGQEHTVLEHGEFLSEVLSVGTCAEDCFAAACDCCGHVFVGEFSFTNEGCKFRASLCAEHVKRNAGCSHIVGRSLDCVERVSEDARGVFALLGCSGQGLGQRRHHVASIDASLGECGKEACGLIEGQTNFTQNNAGSTHGAGKFRYRHA